MMAHVQTMTREKMPPKSSSLFIYKPNKKHSVTYYHSETGDIASDDSYHKPFSFTVNGVKIAYINLDTLISACSNKQDKLLKICKLVNIINADIFFLAEVIRKSKDATWIILKNDISLITNTNCLMESFRFESDRCFNSLSASFELSCFVSPKIHMNITRIRPCRLMRFEENIGSGCIVVELLDNVVLLACYLPFDLNIEGNKNSTIKSSTNLMQLFDHFKYKNPFAFGNISPKTIDNRTV